MAHALFSSGWTWDTFVTFPYSPLLTLPYSPYSILLYFTLFYFFFIGIYLSGWMVGVYRLIFTTINTANTVSSLERSLVLDWFFSGSMYTTDIQNELT